MESNLQINLRMNTYSISMSPLIATERIKTSEYTLYYDLRFNHTPKNKTKELHLNNYTTHTKSMNH